MTHRISFQHIFSEIDPRIKKVLFSILNDEEVNPDFFDNVHYKIFEKVKKEICRIYVSKSYLLCSLWSCQYLVVGVNSETGKLFTRIINRIDIEDDSTTISINGIPIHIISDIEVRRLLSFDLNMEEFDIGSIKPGVRIRIQGDLILTIEGVNSERDYFLRVRGIISHHILQMFREFLIERVNHALTDLGLGVERTETYLLLPVENGSEKLKCFAKLFESVLKSSIIKEIEEQLNEKVLSIWLEEKHSYIQLCIQLLSGTLFFRLYSRRDMNEYIVVEVFFGETLVNTLISSITERIMKELNINYREREMRIGRHKIKMNSLPTQVISRIRLFGRERVVLLNRLPLVVKKLEVYHPEHPPVQIVFPVPVQIFLTTIPASYTFISLYNYFKLEEFNQLSEN